MAPPRETSVPRSFAMPVLDLRFSASELRALDCQSCVQAGAGTERKKLGYRVATARRKVRTGAMLEKAVTKVAVV